MTSSSKQDFCHIEIVLNFEHRKESIDQLIWLQPDPENIHDSRAMAVHNMDGCIGFVTKRFIELAREEYLKGSDLIPLYFYAGSNSIFVCALKEHMV